MPDLLLELFSEEIPARMQARAAADLERLVGEGLKAESLSWEAMESHATPRRIVLHVTGLPDKQPDVREEKRGPRADAPEKAIAGFLSSVGLTRDQVEERAEAKGTFLYAVTEKSGRPTADILQTLLPRVIGNFPWPKSMRWGAGDMRWVRPLHRILCILDGAVVPFTVDGIETGNTTRGHRFHAPKAFAVSGFDDYVQKLKNAHVILDPAKRQAVIRKMAEDLAAEAGLTLVEDPQLLAENAGLTEWPVPLMGRFDEAFLEVPPEVLAATMKKNQKYFTLQDDKGRLANRFICVANLVAVDGGASITAGNERVLSARLSDAKFFWDQDRKIPLEKYAEKLSGIVFHEKLGTVGDKAERMAALARYIVTEADFRDARLFNYKSADPAEAKAQRMAEENSGLHGSDEWEDGTGAPKRSDLVRLAERAARLAKADLVTGMVGEFPEVQGIMGGYYANQQGEDATVANAVAQHYAPLGPADACPSTPVSIAVALSDKLDTLVGFFGIDEKPTGSKDPYALRRAALGVIRLITENDVRLPLRNVFRVARDEYGKQNILFEAQESNLLNFFADRLKAQQREKGVPHDLIDAVFSLVQEDDVVRLLARVTKLRDFLELDDGANLLAGYRRAVNILHIEEKKDKRTFDGAVLAELLQEPQEKALYETLVEAEEEAKAHIRDEGYEGAMAALAQLREPVDAFFDHVTVNAEDERLRENRLNLLNQIRVAVHTVADFSKIQG